MKKSKALQLFSDEYLEYSKKLTPHEIIQFLDDYRKIISSSERSRSKLISIKIPESLLNNFRFKAESQGKKYQTVIKELMKEWLLK